MSLQTHIDTLNKTESHYTRTLYVDALRERFAEFLLSNVTELADTNYDKESLTQVLGGGTREEAYLELIKLLNTRARPELRDQALEFGALAFKTSRSTQCVQLLSSFIGADDADQILGFSGENPMWFLNHKAEVIECGAVSSEQWKLDFVNAAYAKDGQEKVAFNNLFKFYSDSEKLKNIDASSVQERARAHCVGHKAALFISKDVLASLGDTTRKDYIQALTRACQDFKHWEHIDIAINDYGSQLYNASKLTDAAAGAYMLSKIKKTNDVEWLLNVIGNIRHSTFRDQLRAAINHTLASNIEAIAAESVTEIQARNIYHKSVIESLFDRVESDVRKALARNYWVSVDDETKHDTEKTYNWSFVEKHANALVSCWDCYLNEEFEVSRIEWLWGVTTDRAAKRCLLENISVRIRHEKTTETRDELIQLYKRYFEEDSDKYDDENSISYDWESHYYYEDGKSSTLMALDLWPFLGPKLRDHIAATINRSFSVDDYQPSSDNARLLTCLAEHSLEKLVYNSENQIFLLGFLNDQALMSSLPAVFDRVSKSSASVKYLAQGLAKVSCDAVQQQGLYTYGKKNIRDAAQWGLALSNHAEAGGVIQSLLNDKKAKLDDARRSHYLDALEQHGLADTEIKALTPWQSEKLADYCRDNLNASLTKKLTRLWSSELAEAWGDRTEILEYALCVMASDSWGGVPRLTRECFAQVPAIKRQQITNILIETWSAGKADKADYWVLDLLKEYSGENSIPILQKLVVSWHKQYHLRAAAVVKAMGEMDTSFALNSCDEFYQKNKYSDSVRTAALDALKAAAKRREVTLTELYDELVPTFGLSKEGLALDTGTRKFLVKLRATLDLDVIDVATGRAYKNLPKAKAEEDPTLRLEVEAKFKLLKKNVKPMVKGLATRFNNAFDVGLEWKAERWKSLFVTHPILSLVGQGFVWSVTQDEQTQYFRIAEDLSLVDVEDDEVSFDSGVVSLMHPALASADVCSEWSACFDDYEISSFVPQFTASNLSAIDINAETQSFDRFVKSSCGYGLFKRTMQNHNFDVYDGDGSWVSSYIRSYQNTPWSILINLEECRSYMSYDDKVVFAGIEFYQGRDKLNLGDVPKRLISAVVTLMEKLTGNKP